MPELPTLSQILPIPDLELTGLAKDPPFVAPFEISNQLQNSLAHLAACEFYPGMGGSAPSGGLNKHCSRLVQCDAYGRLLVVLAGVGGAGGVLTDGMGALQVNPTEYGSGGAPYGGVAAAVAATQHGMMVYDYYAKLIYDILVDVYDATNHYLRTHAS